MFLRAVSGRHRARQLRDEEQIRKPVKKQSKRRANKLMKPALSDEALKDEYFQHATVEEAEEVTRILECQNHFEVLELDHEMDLDDQEDELRGSYLRKVLHLNTNVSSHPRLTEAFGKLATAYDTLSDPVLRQEHKYDVFGGRPQENQVVGFTDIFDALFQQPPPPRRGFLTRRVNGPAQPIDDPIFAFMNAMMADMQTPLGFQRRDSLESYSEEENDDDDHVVRNFRNLGSQRQRNRLRVNHMQEDRRQLRRRQAEELRRREAEEERVRGRHTRVINENQGPLSILDLIFTPPPNITANRPLQRRRPPGIGLGLPGRVRLINTNDMQPPTGGHEPTRRPMLPPVAQPASEQNVQALVDMGFEEAASRRALNFTNGNLDQAVTILLE